jgi:hypothetical protein
MAAPAAELIFVQLEMDAGLVLCINPFEVELSEILIPRMTIQAGSHGFETQLVGVRKGIVFRGMTIGTVEVPVIGPHEKVGVYDIIRIHPFPDIFSNVFVEIGQVRLTMAFKALPAALG